tara:strand:+ start:65 stop:499 length:435 start_codon:yes stop_codon:yes gene_type:complete
MLSPADFIKIIEHTPLVSIDFILKDDNKYLLGRRINKPAKNYFFTPGGRIYKNEKIKEAIERLMNEELNCKLDREPKFIGVFEHFYNDSIFNGISTHYVNIAFQLDNFSPQNLTLKQHDKYKWFTLEELMKDTSVHDYVKNYFR